MNLVSNGILAVSVASVVLGLLHLRRCFAQRDRWAHILFVSLAFSLAAYAGFERAMMLAATPQELGELLRWAHVLVWLVVVSNVWFIRVFLKTGRTWLLWTVCASRTLALFLNFYSTINLNYVEIHSIKKVSFLGESLSVAVGVPNPLMIVGNVSLILLMVFCIDAAISVWRRGDRQRALTLGASLSLFSISVVFFALSALRGYVSLPLIVSPFFLGFIGSMGYELTREVERSGQLADDLTVSQADLSENVRQLTLSAGAANVGVWTRVIGEETIWASDKWHELFEFEPTCMIAFEDYLQKVVADDRATVVDVLKAAEEGGGEYETEYRVLLRNGDIRWIGSRGKVEFVDGQPVRLRGASVDITKRKQAEEEAHELSRKLMGAQEKERARLARELHDDLSQSLALLSIQLHQLGGGFQEPGRMNEQVAQLTSQIDRLAADVHRISHELHPAKLEQLGLESALRGFCREVAKSHGIKIEFEAVNVPRLLPDDVALCLYRVAQESLQNITKHSGADHVRVSISRDGDEIRLLISDSGCGFDPTSARTSESLGLVSMSERIRAVKGSLKIESSMGAGTKINALVPIAIVE